MQLMSIKIGLLSVLLLKTCVRKKGGLGGFAPQTLTRSYYFEPPLSKKRSRATVLQHQNSSRITTVSNFMHYQSIGDVPVSSIGKVFFYFRYCTWSSCWSSTVILREEIEIQTPICACCAQTAGNLSVAYARGGFGGQNPPIGDWKKLKTALFGPISVFSYRDCVFLCCIKLPI